MKYIFIFLGIILIPIHSHASIMVSCHLAKYKKIGNQKLCIYTGANKTYEILRVNDFKICTKQIQCKYEKDKKPPPLESIIKSIEKEFDK